MTIPLQPVADINVYPDGRLDRRNAARYMGCPSKTLAIWASQGTGPPYCKLGKRVFYFKEDLDAWIQSHRATSTADYRAKQRQAQQTAVA